MGGLHLNRRNGRRMYLSYFVLVDVLVFVLVDEHLIWYSCMYLVMSLLQYKDVNMPRPMSSMTVVTRTSRATGKNTKNT